MPELEGFALIASDTKVFLEHVRCDTSKVVQTLTEAVQWAHDHRCG